MGWLTKEEQLEVLKRFRVQALYICDGCHLPIPIQEMPVVDPKKGYHSWKTIGTPKSCRSFSTKEPKVTYHQGKCNDKRLGRRPRKPKNNKSKGEDMAKKENKKSKKSSKKGKSKGSNGPSDAVKKAMKGIVSAIAKKPKKGYWTKKKLAEKLGEKYGKKEVRSAIRQLRSGKKQLDKHGDSYLLKEKKGKKDASDASDASDSSDASE